MKYTVVIDTDGTLYGIWADELLELYQVESGKVEVERASNVEFNVETQRWHVYEPTGDHVLMQTACGLMWPNLEGWRSRADALAWEKQEIERRLIEENH